ncbi:hypothetical protein [Tannerella forsythia]|uniref:hypothetical protein n=1 Tax=Tannerella forsythia TaxID=28112 RepID=UPI00163A322E|nr:hypothetical protein [Tannerella forsythia]
MDSASAFLPSVDMYGLFNHHPTIVALTGTLYGLISPRLFTHRLKVHRSLPAKSNR